MTLMKPYATGGLLAPYAADERRPPLDHMAKASIYMGRDSHHYFVQVDPSKRPAVRYLRGDIADELVAVLREFVNFEESYDGDHSVKESDVKAATDRALAAIAKAGAT